MQTASPLNWYFRDRTYRSHHAIDEIDPFLQTIVDVVVLRMVFDRVCLLGDAAFVVRPHTAGAAAKAARDAMVLAAALKGPGRMSMRV
jgi:2-polyprenyl-6-methoxyphenol hydroxylase-like FAD-dependent oxidoreductase